MVLGYFLNSPVLLSEEVSILYNRIALDITLSQMKIVCVYDGSQTEKKEFCQIYLCILRWKNMNIGILIMNFIII